MDGVARPMAVGSHGKKPSDGSHRMVPDAGNSNAGVARTDAGDADARRSEGTRTFLRAVNIVPDALLTRLGAFEKGRPGTMLAALEAGAKKPLPGD